jgi:hypothetical protein
VSVTASASASPTRTRNGEAAGQARRAAILETGKGHEHWALACERRGTSLGHRPHRADTWTALQAVWPPRTPWAPTPRPALGCPPFHPVHGAGQHHPAPSPLPGPGEGKKQARAGRQDLRWPLTLLEAVTAITWGREATTRSRRSAWAGPGRGSRASDVGTNPVLVCCNALAFPRSECASGPPVERAWKIHCSDFLLAAALP